MNGRVPDSDFWRGKRVLVTGHTGFKGAWAALWLSELGAAVTGFALPPVGRLSLFSRAKVADSMVSILGDLRDMDEVEAAVQQAAPDIVLHMAAQALVRPSVSDPIGTITSNVVGTANLLDVLRRTPPATILVVTSDKVYFNDEHGRAFAEEDRLGGDDPYSASKAACEIISRSYFETYFRPAGVRLATARGGNVIGGGDDAVDRIVPDIVRAVSEGKKPPLRMPHAVRPWQHVLDCLNGYLCYLEDLDQGVDVPGALNFGPAELTSLTVGELTLTFLDSLHINSGYNATGASEVKEMGRLHIDATLARDTLGWRSLLDTESAVKWTAAWYADAGRSDKNVRECTLDQIAQYHRLFGD